MNCSSRVSSSLTGRCVFSAANAKDAGIPANFDQGYGDKHVAGYAKLWGMQ